MIFWVNNKVLFILPLAIIVDICVVFLIFPTIFVYTCVRLFRNFTKSWTCGYIGLAGLGRYGLERAGLELADMD